MADEQKSLTDVAKNTGELLQEAGTKTTQTVLAHTEKYHDAYTTIDKIVDSFWERVPYICIAIVVFLIFWLLTKLFKFFVRKTLENRSYTRQNLVLVLNRVGSTAILFFGFLILWSEPFRMGASIVVNSLEGTVEDIQIRATFLRSPDGRRIVIPNATVYTSALTVNTAYQQRRCEFVVGIGYDDDEQKAKQIILDILNNDRNVLSQPAFSVNVTALADFSVNLTVRWWVDTTETDISSSISNIQAQVKQAFNENDIDIPYPIQELKMVSNPPALNPETSAKQTT